MNVNQIYREQHEVAGATPDPRKAKRTLPSFHKVTKPVLKELTILVRDLHQSLESYGPRWYTEQLDTRMSGALGAAKCVARNN